MTSAPAFPSTTEQFTLPMLFAGQAQKEFFINQAFAMIDGLIQFGVDATLTEPPPASIDGAIFRIAPSATGDWSGKDDQIALRVAGAWNYFAPTEGMQVFDRSTRQLLIFKSNWIAATEPAPPTGGNVIDQEARDSINELIQALRNAGIFQSPA